MALPSSVSSVPPKLQARSGKGTMRDRREIGMCPGAPTLKRTLCAAAHFSSLSTPFPLMQFAIIMAEATPSRAPSLLPERSIFSVGFVPVSSSI